MKIKHLNAWIIFLSAFFYIFLIYGFPINTGGVGIFFIFTVPMNFIVSLILALIYRYKIQNQPKKIVRNSFFYLALLSVFIFGYSTFPCGSNNKNDIYSTPCPCSMIQIAVDLKSNEENIEFSDIFEEEEDKNIYASMLKQTAALKKFKNRLPELPANFYSIYNSTSKKSYVVYFKNGKAHSTNQKLKIWSENNSKISFQEITAKDTFTFKSSTNGFHKNDDDYEYNVFTEDFKKTMEHGTIEFSPRKIYVYEEYLIYDFMYFLIK